MSSIDEINKRVREALSLLTTEQADAIIAEPGPEYAALIKGAQAAIQLCWLTMQSCGAKKNTTSLGYVGKTTVILAQMIHFAYALGMQKGQR